MSREIVRDRAGQEHGPYEDTQSLAGSLPVTPLGAGWATTT